MNIIIAGAGSVGRYLVERLAAEDHNVTLIDLDNEILDEVANQFDIQAVIGNASILEDLKKTGIEEADIIVAATDSDETNLITCLLADSLNERIRKIARVRDLVTDESGLSPRIREVFDHFINPNLEATRFLMRLFEVPGASEVIDFADGRVRVVGVSLIADSPVIGQQLKDIADMADLSSMRIVAIARGGQLIIPSGEDRLEAGDTVYIAAEPSQTNAIFEMLGFEPTPIRSAMIWAGGGAGQELARELIARGVKVKLVHAKPEHCVRLAGEFDDVLILRGEGTDQDLLVNEGIDDIDVFVGATGNDEENIMSALLAKSLGARQSAVLLNKTTYLNLVNTIGIDIAVSPRIAAASSILKFLRRGSVSSVFSTRDDTAEVLEIIANEKSKVIGKPLRDISFPSGVIVAAVVNEDLVTIPTGDTTIIPEDRVILFAHRSALPKLEKLLEFRFSLF